MKKNTPAPKNTCKFCCEPVNCNTGIQCKGACKKWMHFECLNYTPGKILDIKKGNIQVNCPCPTCKTSAPREIIVDRGDKACPKTPVCGEPLCPSHFKNQDINQPCPPNPPCPPKPTCPPNPPSPPKPPCPPNPPCPPKPTCPPTSEPVTDSDNDVPCTKNLEDPPTPPTVKEPGCLPPRKPCPEYIPCRPSSEPKSKPKARPIPKLDCKPKQKPKVEKSSQPCPTLMKQMLERSKECASHKTIIFFPEHTVPCECPPPESSETKSVDDECFPPKRVPPCEAPPPPPKKIRCPPEKQPSGMKCLCCSAEDEPEPESDWECSSPKSTRSYPECCPQGPDGQRDLPCGYFDKNASDYKISSKNDNNDALICTLQNLCATMGELSKQVKNLMGNLVPNC